MLIPEYVLYPITLLIGIHIICLCASGFEGVKECFLFIVSLPLTVLALIMDTVKKRTIKFDTDSLKFYLVAGVGSIFLLWMGDAIARDWIINKICPFVIVVNDDSTEKEKYKVYVALGKPVINGETHNLGIGETLIVNESRKSLIYKSVTYLTRSKALSAARCHYGSDRSSIIERGQYLVVEDYPDYFFQSPPDRMTSAFSTETIYVLDFDYNK